MAKRYLGLTLLSILGFGAVGYNNYNNLSTLREYHKDYQQIKTENEEIKKANEEISTKYKISLEENKKTQKSYEEIKKLCKDLDKSVEDMEVELFGDPINKDEGAYDILDHPYEDNIQPAPKDKVYAELYENPNGNTEYNVYCRKYLGQTILDEPRHGAPLFMYKGVYTPENEDSGSMKIER